jgi:outer membrane protein assembly factor BamE
MRKALVLLLAAALLSGCGFIYRQPVFQGTLLEKSNVEQLQPGMTKAQVVALLGSPPVADPFHHERWDYIASEQRRRHKAEIKNLTVWFEGDSLTKIEGEYFPEKDTELLQEMPKFGFYNLPREEKQRR